MLEVGIAFLISLSVAVAVGGLLYLGHKAFGTFIGKSILPVQGESPPIPEEFEKSITSDPKCKSKILTTLPDGAPNDRHILCFLGNDTSVLEKSNEGMFKDLANVTKASVIGFDYPNVGIGGKGAIRSEKALVNEGIAQVQRLLDQGIEANKITLYGHSLGGAVATLVAAHFHDKKPPQAVSLINDRSFTTAGDQAVSLLGLKNAFVIGVFKMLFNLSWKMDALSAYNKIPENNKMVISGPDDKNMNYATVALAGQMPLSENCFIVDGDHDTPLTELRVQQQFPLSGQTLIDTDKIIFSHP